MTPETFQAFEAHAAGCAPFECCGLILADPERYFPCWNVAEGDSEFRIHAEDWASAEDLGTILAVCHSHPGSTARPGPADLRGCEHTGLPWFILGNDGLWRLDPREHRESLERRVFKWGWADCFSLVRDYFGQDMPDFPRTKEDSARLYAEQAERLGWVEVSREDMRKDDLILMQIQDPRGPNHSAVYLGGGWILHHLFGRMSCREYLNGTYQAAIRKVLRRVS